MSDTPKWTRGPWKIDATSLQFYIFGKPDNVASIIKPIGSHLGTEKALANARLISAAPDLYQALEKMTKAYADLKHDIMEGYADPYPEAPEAARRALAKARGEDAT